MHPLIPILRTMIAQIAWDIPFNAVRNCHAWGMDSIVLSDNNGSQIRLFIANENHTLWRNRGNECMSVAIHPHHCDLWLFGLVGNPFNDVYEGHRSDQGRFTQMLHTSALKSPDGIGKLEPTGARYDLVRGTGRNLNGVGVFMPARTLHTIFVPKGEYAAWMVVEGVEDDGYEAFCYTNAVFAQELNGLYQKMDRRTVTAALHKLCNKLGDAK